MKLLSYVFAGLSLFSTCLMTSCGDEDFEGLVSGAAIVLADDGTNSTRLLEVHDGDAVTLSVGAIVGKGCNLQIVRISGINHPPFVHYLIDGQEIGKSRDFESFFSYSYKVEGLEPGEHTLSVDVPQIFNNIFYVTDVASTTFSVLPKDGDPAL